MNGAESTGRGCWGHARRPAGKREEEHELPAPEGQEVAGRVSKGPGGWLVAVPGGLRSGRSQGGAGS